jgi:hypothetical protein
LQKDIKKNKKRRAIREDAGSSPDSSYEVDSEQRKMINLDDVREKNEEGDDSYHSEELSDYTIHLGNALSGRRMIKRD